MNNASTEAKARSPIHVTSEMKHSHLQNLTKEVFLRIFSADYIEHLLDGKSETRCVEKLRGIVVAPLVVSTQF